MGSAPIYIVSGGVGYCGEQLVRTVLAQFPVVDVTIYTVPFVRHVEQIDEVIAQAAASGGTIVHTLVAGLLRDALVHRCANNGVTQIDLMGPLIGRMREVASQEPLGLPELYRQQQQSQLERIAAINYTLAHDDGLHPEGWRHADVLVLGVSRVGKTPTSIYLAVLGWKIANLPLVKDMRPPPELFELDRRRVVGLTIGLEELIAHRTWRQHQFGHLLGGDAYVSARSLSEELEWSDRLFRRGGFRVVDVTQKPVEAIANEVIAKLPKAS
jgi:[pyruvate, water dikinase]-phosphate phosphotransferase / [pyruvate, water dikinase] kinase